MKILVISHMYPSTFNEINGIFVHQQVKELTKQGCKMKMISPIAWTPFPIKYLRKKWKAYSKMPERINWDGVEVYHLRYLEFPRALSFASSGGRMYWRIKGIDLNSRAIAKLKEKYPSLIYLIIGRGKEREKLEKLAQGLGLKDEIEFLG